MLINILLGLDIRETFKVSKFYRKLLSFTGTFNGSLVNSVLTGSFSTNSLSVRTNLFNIMAEAGLGSSVS
jgi:phage tail tube protein FII